MSEIVNAIGPGGVLVPLPIGDLLQTFGYTGTQVTSISVVYSGKTYVQTITYSGDNISTISPFVVQP